MIIGMVIHEKGKIMGRLPNGVAEGSALYLQWLMRQREHYFLVRATQEEFEQEMTRLKALRSRDSAKFPYRQADDAERTRHITLMERDIVAVFQRAKMSQIVWKNFDVVSVQFYANGPWYNYFREDGIWPGKRVAMTDSQMTEAFIEGRVQLLARDGSPFPRSVVTQFRTAARDRIQACRSDD